MTRQARRYWRGYQAGVWATRWKYLCLGGGLVLGVFLAMNGLEMWLAHTARQALAPGATITITPRVDEGWAEPLVIRPTCHDCLEL